MGRRRRLHPVAWAAFGVLALMLAAVLAPGLFTPFGPESQDLLYRLTPPGAGGHLLGTDGLGEDVWSQIVYGTGVSVGISLAGVVSSLCVGTVAGSLAGYFGGWVDAAVSRLVDAQIAVPYLVLAIAIVFVAGAGAGQMVVVMTLAGWVTYARVVRAIVLSLRAMPYIEAAVAAGGSSAWVLTRHVLRNLTAPVTALATLQVGQMILTTSTLAFLGLGLPANIPTWGGTAADGQDYLATAWWIATFPGLAILVATLAFNYAGDAVRQLLESPARAGTAAPAGQPAPGVPHDPPETAVV
jgi:peptide/nickel transport system permease protein